MLLVTLFMLQYLNMMTSMSPSGIIRKLDFSNFSQNKIFIGVLSLSLIAGIGTGYLLSVSNSKMSSPAALVQTPKTADQDNKTFRDFAEGTLEKKPDPKAGTAYSEGTHFLKRDKAVPVALTSSVVDLSQFEGKKVKVFGETQKALKEGWLMDVGKVEEK